MDREKVISNLQGVYEYLRHFENTAKMGEWVADALALLKEQEAAKPKYNARTNWYECGNCHYSMTSGMHCRSELIPATKVRYCANCGFPVDWEGR